MAHSTPRASGVRRPARSSRRLRVSFVLRLLGVALAGVVALAGGRASAAVAFVSGFAATPLANANPSRVNWTSPNISVTPGAGTNRVLVVAVTMELGSNGNFSASATYNGATATQATVTTSTNAAAGVWIGYFKEANLPTGAANLVVTINSAQTFTGVSVFAATFQGVDQTTPTTGVNQIYGTTAAVSVPTAISASAGGAYVAVVSRPTNDADTITPATFTAVSNENNLGSTVGYKLTPSAVSERTTSTLSTAGAQALGAVALSPAAPTGTLTLADGAAPTNATLCAAPATTGYIDYFTLLGSAATNVTGVTTTFSPTLPTGLLSLLEVTNDAGTAQGSLANPSGANPAVTGMSFAAPTGTAAQYRLRITPSATTTTSGTFTATVTGATTSGGFGVTGTDGTSATIIVDGAASPVVTGATATGGTGTVTANWTNPAAGTVPATDFGNYVVVLGNTVATTGAPAKGTSTYAVGTAVGADSVICSGNLATCAKTGLASSQPYYLTIFTRDGCANWSAGVAVNATTAAAPNTAIGDGVNPTVAATWVAPGTGAVAIDSFTVLKSGGTQAESLTALQLTFATGTAQGIGLVEVMNDALTTTYGSFTNPADVQAITLTTPITPTTTSTQYKLRVTPKTHAAMPAPPGASYAVRARVTDVTVTYTKSVADTASATLNVDNASSPNVSVAGVTVTGTSVTANWTNPAAGTVPDTDFASYVVVLGNTVPVTGAPSEGTTSYTAGAAVGADSVVCSGNLTSCQKTGLGAGQAFYFEIFTRDALGNWSTGATASGTTTDGRTTPVALAATAASCSLVNLTASYTGDLPTSNNSVTFARAAAAAGPFTSLATCTSVGGGSNPRTCSDGAVIAGQTWYYRATFADADGVVGSASVDSGAVVVPACGATLAVASGTMPAGASVGAGTSGVPVARIALTPSGSVDLTSIAFANLGTALADLDVATLSLYDDTTSTFIANAWFDSGTARYVFAGFASTIASAKTLRVDLSAAAGATAGRTFIAQLPAGAVTVAAPAAVGTYAAITGGTFTFAAGTNEGNTNAAAPMVSIVNPSPGVVSGNFKVQVRVFNPTAGLAGITGVQVSTDNGATWPCTATQNTNYAATNAGIYECVVTAAAIGPHTLRAKAVNNVPLTTLSGPVLVTARAARSGDGNLLVRDNASQLCSDCHGGIKSHSSENTSTKYGAWATACRDCHQPHQTRNVELMAEAITPPAVNGTQATRNVGFAKLTGDSNAAGWDSANRRPTANGSFVNTDLTGPCQVCHTRTVDPNAAAPQPARWRNTGNSDTAHYAATGANGTAPCSSCHSHTNGFAAGEPGVAGSKCGGCHATIFSMVKTGGQANAHRIDLDQSGDTTLDWTTVTNLADVASTQRSCLNMCHGDHPHDLTSPATTSHQGNVYADPSTNASRGAASAARVASGATPVNRATSDFDPATNTGLCVKCHQKPIAAGGITVTAAAFGASAHDYTFNTYGTWTYPLHDGSTFARNCTKCHASRAEGTTPAYGNSGTRALSTVHGGPDASLLAGVTNPATTNGTVDATKRATFVCYNCHGNSTVGANLSGKDIQSQVNHANNAAPQSGHPSDKDAVHVSTTEYANAAFGSGLGAGVARHAACEDCHDTHQAKAGLRTVGGASGSTIGGALAGAWGADLTSNPAFWTAPSSANLSKATLVTGTPAAGQDNLEATLCFKCHSAWYGTLPIAPSSVGLPAPIAAAGYTETDTAMEFNPGNAGNWKTAGTANTYDGGETAGSFHPVLADSSNNLGAITLTNLVTTNFAWSTTARNRMRCSDCHASDVNTDPVGPHGSAARFILRGPNTTWNASLNSVATAGIFCWNCHAQNSTNTRYSAHGTHNGKAACFTCHSAIPHGSMRPGLLSAGNGGCGVNGGTTCGQTSMNINVGGPVVACANGNGAGTNCLATDNPPYNQAPSTYNKLRLAYYPANQTTNWGSTTAYCGCGNVIGGQGH